MKNLMTNWLCVAILLLASNGVFAGVAGHVMFVSGDVSKLSSTGKVNQLKKGDAINEGDTLTSAPSASAQIKMEDGGLIALRSDTQLKFDQFNFNGQQDGTEKSFVSLLKGGFRAVTGLIGKVNKNNYRITTPSATIGIRGTDHEIYVVVLGSAMATTSPVGTYNKVNTGETSMSNNKGAMLVLPNQMCFVGSVNEMPVIQSMDTHIFNVTPAPQGKSDKHKDEVREMEAQDDGEVKLPSGNNGNGNGNSGSNNSGNGNGNGNGGAGNNSGGNGNGNGNNGNGSGGNRPITGTGGTGSTAGQPAPKILF